VVGRVLVDMLVANTVARADDERRAELVGALARLPDPVARPMCTPRSAEAARVEQQPERVDPGKRSRGRRSRVVVDEEGEGDPLPLDEVGGVVTVAGPDHHDLGAEAPDFVVVLTQLRGVLPAEQSTEVAEEDQHDRPVLPIATQPVVDAGRVRQLDSSECPKIYGRQSRTWRRGDAGDATLEPWRHPSPEWTSPRPSSGP